MWLERAGDYARTILSTLTREYPNALRHTMRGPDDRPTPREVHPAFYGSFDWHSCVEMHWALIRLLRLATGPAPSGLRRSEATREDGATEGPGARASGASANATAPASLPVDEIRAVLGAHLIPDALAVETAYLVEHPGFARPYGRGWVLALAHELLAWDDDPYAAQWAAAITPLGDAVAAGLADWLPKLTYPERYGVHANTAFALSRSLPFARMREASGLADAIEAAARRFFADDTDYPAAWEPSGADFLSPALTEAALMSAVLPAGEFAGWFDAFLPALPPSLANPAVVSDPTDGQLAHLAGLNFSRAWGFKRIAAALPTGHPRRPDLLDAAASHDEAGLPYATGGDYMVEHWLASYAVLSLS